jgi:hypothetical protein
MALKAQHDLRRGARRPSRVPAKILSHTVAIVLTARAGHQPLQFDALAA